ncbi:hypothetical protein EAS61_37630 [Bradyrhizobium zhanjiangense]|uniref:Uncharacterized protein n=1 Tax=Bradyrhizobium zhanjiangense TaxID=1325107 RepID=A0A4Q0Q846_9BRAD|nr:hypothetical protein EAS61_37630 [Bradyrhizobium zhanjiangense]
MRRSNPDCLRGGGSLDCFAPLAMTTLMQLCAPSLASRAPDAAQRFFSGALQSRGPCNSETRRPPGSASGMRECSALLCTLLRSCNKTVIQRN